MEIKNEAANGRLPTLAASEQLQPRVIHDRQRSLNTASTPKFLRVGPIDGFDMGDLVMVTSGARNLFVLPARDKALVQSLQNLSLFSVDDLPVHVDKSARQLFIDNLLESGVCIDQQSE